ncbi:MAG: hypothetical protein M9929_05810 [Burkholderiaceae bacterium]|nr:hypothetical protein [Burkholderiaceae bacterium]
MEPPALCRYLLWRLTQERGISVRYKDANISPDTFLVVGKRGDAMESFVILDGDKSMDDRLDFVAPLLIIPSSVTKNEYSDKYSSKFTHPLYMPNPTREEVLLMADACFSGVAGAGGRTGIEERMDRWGPIPRWVLANRAIEGEELANALRDVSASALAAAFRGPSLQATCMMLSFRLIHYDDDVGERMNRVSYKWASPYIQKAMEEKFRCMTKRDFLHSTAMLLQTKDTFRLLGNNLFEEFASRRMEAGGMFRIKRLCMHTAAGGMLRQWADAAVDRQARGQAPSAEAVVAARAAVGAAAAAAVVELPPPSVARAHATAAAAAAAAAAARRAAAAPPPPAAAAAAGAGAGRGGGAATVAAVRRSTKPFAGLFSTWTRRWVPRSTKMEKA